MSRLGWSFGIVASALTLSGLIWSGTARTQEDQRPRFDREQMRQRMMDGIKEQLGTSDDEWKALSPKVEKVMAAARESGRGGMGGMGMFFGRGGPGGPGGGRGRDPGRAEKDSSSQSPVSKASDELRTALDDKKTSGEDIGKKLTTYRQARDKAKDDLVKAQKDLRELLTQRQEATLVLGGMLD